MPVVPLYKPLGLTPLQALKAFRQHYPQYRDSVLSYAGRLDPLAEGVMLVLVDEANQERDNYLNLDKEYECEILFGVSTDTGDLLGKVTGFEVKQLVPGNVEAIVHGLKGKRTQRAPRYSAPGLDGKEFSREVEIKELTIGSWRTISSGELLGVLNERIKRVVGNFRQAEILSLWQETLRQQTEFSVLKISLLATSGTYIRVLAEDVGRGLNIPALVFSIKRTQVGDYQIADCLKI